MIYDSGAFNRNRQVEIKIVFFFFIDLTRESKGRSQKHLESITRFSLER